MPEEYANCPYCDKDVWEAIRTYEQEYSNLDTQERAWHDACVKEWCGKFEGKK